MLQESSPAAKGQQDVTRLRELCRRGQIADRRSFTREEESAWWKEVDAIVLYYLGSDHEEYLALCRAPDVQTFGGPLVYWDFGDDDDELNRTFQYSKRVVKRLQPLNRCIELIEEQIKTLPDKPMDVRERRRQREQFIRALRDLAEGHVDVPIALGHIVDKAGLHATIARDIASDLGHSGHVMGHADHYYALTVKGRDWAEELEDPTPTAAASITNQFFDRVGIVQQGNYNTAIQQLNAGPQEYIALLDRLREAASVLPDAQRVPLLAQEENLREELSNKEPKWKRVAGYFQAGALIVSSVKDSAPIVYEAFHQLGALIGPYVQQFLG